jgi:cell pole-organizing protein PopZ
MNQPAKAPEPSMEEILASIRRIIADDDTAKTPPAKPAPAPTPVAAAPKPAPAPPPAKPSDAGNSQDDIDALFASFDSTPEPEPEPPPPPPPPPPVAAAPAPRPAPPPPADDILELTEAMRTPAPAFQKIEAHSDVVFSEPSGWDDEPAARPATRPIPASYAEVPPDRPLMSSTTSAAVDSAFNALAQTVLVHNARTLEDLVREMLRPMLKAWLDDNLPQMVERMVRAEIDRVSRGRNS